jgi:hypothetical protein
LHSFSLVSHTQPRKAGSCRCLATSVHKPAKLKVHDAHREVKAAYLRSLWQSAQALP